MTEAGRKVTAGDSALADALHLAASRRAQAFYSFNQSLAKKARKASTIPSEKP